MLRVKINNIDNYIIERQKIQAFDEDIHPPKYYFQEQDRERGKIAVIRQFSLSESFARRDAHLARKSDDETNYFIYGRSKSILYFLILQTPSSCFSMMPIFIRASMILLAIPYPIKRLSCSDLNVI
jgi:hypothetical protein